MKMLTKNTDYAVRALMHLAQAGEVYVSAAEVSRREKIPEKFLKVLMQKMIRGKLLLSKEGASGGVRLAKDPGTIRLTDLIALFQGGVSLSACMEKKTPCPNRSDCVLRSRIKNAERTLSDELAGITIQTLINDMEEKQ